MSEYIFVTNIFEYSNIRIYSSHSAPYHTVNIQQPEGNCGGVYCGLAAKWVL